MHEEGIKLGSRGFKWERISGWGQSHPDASNSWRFSHASFFLNEGARNSRARRSLRLARQLFLFDDLRFSPRIAYKLANVRPPEGENFVSVPSRPWAA